MIASVPRDSGDVRIAIRIHREPVIHYLSPKVIPVGQHRGIEKLRARGIHFGDILIHPLKSSETRWTQAEGPLDRIIELLLVRATRSGIVHQACTPGDEDISRRVKSDRAPPDPRRRKHQPRPCGVDFQKVWPSLAVRYVEGALRPWEARLARPAHEDLSVTGERDRRRRASRAASKERRPHHRAPRIQLHQERPDRKSTRLNSSHVSESRMPSS